MVEALVQSLLGLPPLAYPLILATCLGAYLFFWFVFVRGTPCRSKQRMDGKTVIVTGANTGIGKITAEELARRGARVVMACRDMARGRAALSEVREGAGSENVVLRQLDLASCDSIRAFAELVLKEEQAIHVLVCNAGVAYVPFQKTVDGFELTFGVNHLGHFLLTNLLLDRIKESAPARIVVVSSSGHYFNRGLNFDDLMLVRSYNRYKAYFQSKLANVMFGRELAKRLEGTGVSVYSLHPGCIRTEILRHTFAGWTFFLKPLFLVMINLFLKTPWYGAQTSIYCAIAKEAEGISGKYWHDCVVKTPNKQALRDKDCERLWDCSAAMVGLDREQQ